MKTHTELTLASKGDIGITLEFENLGPENCDAQIQVAKVGDITVTIDQEAIDRKQSALEVASLIDKIADPAGQELAVNSVATLKAYLNRLEKSRKETKQPFWDAGNAIDDIAKKAKADVVLEVERVESLLSAYQEEVNKKAAEERRRQEEEARRQERAAQAALQEEQRLREEAERKSWEAEELAIGATDALGEQAADAARAAAEGAAKAADALAAQRRQGEQAAQWSSGPPGLPAIPEKPKGTAVNQGWDIEAVDVLYLIREHGLRFVRVELDLQAIKFYLGLPNSKPTLPGLRITPKTSVHVRAERN